MSFLNPLYEAVAWLLVHIHSGVAKIISSNGWSWALAIVLLTMAMRLALFPVFVKQIRNQRAMQVLQPKMKELQAKYKNDKERLNQEMMALWKEHNANPFSGCLPLLLQIPIFIALFHTLREIKTTCAIQLTAAVPVCPPDQIRYPSVPGFPSSAIASAVHAKIFGAFISASFRTSTATLRSLEPTVLHPSQTSTRVLALVLTVLMSATTFITQRQLMAQNNSSGNSQMMQQQKILLYVFPLFFLFYGFTFPIGVLLYWLTTNVWSMVQQRVVIRHMDSATAPSAAASTATPSGPAVGAKPTRAAPPAKSVAPPEKSVTPPPKPRPASAGGDIALPPGGAIPPGAVRPKPPTRPNPNRSKKRKKGRR